MYDYIYCPAVSKHPALLCCAAFPFIPFRYCLQSCTFNRSKHSYSVFLINKIINIWQKIKIQLCSFYGFRIGIGFNHQNSFLHFYFSFRGRFWIVGNDFEKFLSLSYYRNNVCFLDRRNPKIFICFFASPISSDRFYFRIGVSPDKNSSFNRYSWRFKTVWIVLSSNL